MRAECKGNATAKARGQGGGGRGQRGKGAQPSQRRKRALAQKHTKQHETTLKPPRLCPFAPFGEVSAPFAPYPDSLPPASLLFRLHPLASACIGFSPFASACIGLQPRHLPLRVGGSGCRVGVSGRGCRVGVSGRGVGSPPAPAPPRCAQTKKAWYRKPCFLFIDLMYHFYHVLVCVHVCAPVRARKNLPNFVRVNDLCRFPLEIRLRFYCTAVPIIVHGYQSSNFRTLSSSFRNTLFRMSSIITLSQLLCSSRLTNSALIIALSCTSQGFIKSAFIISSFKV